MRCDAGGTPLEGGGVVKLPVKKGTCLRPIFEPLMNPKARQLLGGTDSTERGLSDVGKLGIFQAKIRAERFGSRDNLKGFLGGWLWMICGRGNWGHTGISIDQLSPEVASEQASTRQHRRPNKNGDCWLAYAKTQTIPRNLGNWILPDATTEP